MSGPGWFTYFVQRGEDGPIKIGRAHDVARRVKGLACATPEPLRVLGVLPGNVEAEHHARFTEHRIGGEWFAPAGPVLAAAIAARAEHPALTLAAEKPLERPRRVYPAPPARKPMPAPERRITVDPSLASSIIGQVMGLALVGQRSLPPTKERARTIFRNRPGAR